MLFVGIDISAKTISVAFRLKGAIKAQYEYENTQSGFKKLIKHIKKYKTSTRICMEATGLYYLDCAIALESQKGVEVMVINPRGSKHFAEVIQMQSKTDQGDAQMLAEYCERMDFLPWVKPENYWFTLRTIARQMTAITHAKSKAKNQLHALTISVETPKVVVQSQQRLIEAFEAELDELEKAAIEHLKGNEKAWERLRQLKTLPGFGIKSAICALGEICLLPSGMEKRHWVSHSGLNPIEYQSGTSVRRGSRISRRGNSHLRRGLFMPALTAIRTNEYVKAYYHHLVEDNGLCKMQAVVAVMRKLLCSIHGMERSGKDFDGKLFYAGPLLKEAVVLTGSEQAVVELL